MSLISSRTSWLFVASILVGCNDGGGGPSGGGSEVHVTRDGKPSEDFASVAFACTIQDSEPPSGLSSLDCVFGNPDGGTGLHLEALVDTGIEDSPEGTVLAMGADFDLVGFEGGTDGSIWGASGFSSWWTGNLALTIGARSAAGLAATMEGSIDTTPEVQVTPIHAVFDATAATLP
jgi:hypothetical protein